jgi:hypothetical protein
MRIGARIAEEYRRSAYEDLNCDWKILCVIFVVVLSDSFCVEIRCYVTTSGNRES